MRRERAVDEAHRAGTGAERVRRRVGGGEHVGMMRQRQVAVAVHPQEVAIASLQPIARAAAAGGRHVADDDAFGRLGAAFLAQPRDVGERAPR